MFTAVFSIFLISALTPFLARPVKKIYGYILAAGTLPLLVYFFSFLNEIRSGKIIASSYSWFPPFDLRFSFYLDGLSFLFALIILGIGVLIFFYSNTYMKHDHHQERFYAFMLLFMGSMLGLVLAGNLISLYLFWSLTSLSSFLLIGFYSNEAGSRRAALQALIVTEAGGFAMLAGFILLGNAAGTYDISIILSDKDFLLRHAYFTPILLLLLAGAFTKSAQFPFHFWLPSAMKAPTPVSAYLHSASMVNGGIYLLARFVPLFAPSPLWKNLLLAVGLTTFFIGVYLSVPRRDIKSILAYTTISSLGLMVFLLGIGTSSAVKAALLYLVVHALFKSALFLVAGIVDEKTGTRDIYAAGFLWRTMKVTAIIALLALLSMAGIPPMLGYIGKETVYEAALHAPGIGWAMTGIIMLSNALMFLVSAILAYELFFNKPEKNTTARSGKAAGFTSTAGAAVLAFLCLWLAVLPGVFEPVLKQAVQAVTEKPVEVDLKLWHGFNQVFRLSLGTLLLGMSLFLARKYLLPVIEKINAYVSPVKFSDLFLKASNEIFTISAKMARTVQHGHNNLYLLVIFIASGLFFWFLLLVPGTGLFGWKNSEFSIYTTGIALLICLSAVVAAITGRKLAAIITMGVTGYGIAMIYFLYSAIDLSITQLLIETLTLVIFAMVVYKLPQFEKYSPRKTRIRDGLVALAVGGSMTGLVLLTGAAREAPLFEVSKVLAEKSFSEAHGRNIVNVILIDFRALDTMGEITVVLLAALGIYSMLSFNLKKKKI